jgi:hypothetical protein
MIIENSVHGFIARSWDRKIPTDALPTRNKRLKFDTLSDEEALLPEKFLREENNTWIPSTVSMIHPQHT